MTGGATYREFVEQVKHAYGRLTENTHDRDPTPMLIFDSPGGVRMVGVEADFFDPDQELREELLRVYVLPAIHEYEATKVAWAFSAYKVTTLRNMNVNPPDAVGASEEVVIAVVVDPEVHEVWYAPRLKDEDTQALGPWSSWPANEPITPAIAAIQGALR